MMNENDECTKNRQEIDFLAKQIEKEMKNRVALIKEAGKDYDEAIARLRHDREHLSVFEYHEKKEIDRKIEEFTTEYFAFRSDIYDNGELFDILDNLSGVSYNPDDKTVIANSEKVRNEGVKRAQAVLAKTISKPEFKYEAVHDKSEPNHLASLKNAIAIIVGALILISLLFSCASPGTSSSNEKTTTYGSSSGNASGKSNYAKAAEEASHYYYDSAGHIHRDNR